MIVLQVETLEQALKEIERLENQCEKYSGELQGEFIVIPSVGEVCKDIFMSVELGS